MLLNKCENNAVQKLQALAGQWPDSLWIFSADGKLHVMRLDVDGKPMMTPFGGVDPDYCVATIDIRSDGGDW